MKFSDIQFPADYEAESAVIGILLIVQRTDRYMVLGELNDDMFFDSMLYDLFRRIKSAYGMHQTPMIRYLHKRAIEDCRGDYERAKDFRRLVFSLYMDTDGSDCAPNVREWKYYARRLRDAADKRRACVDAANTLGELLSA